MPNPNPDNSPSNSSNTKSSPRIEVLVYEPELQEDVLFNSHVEKDLNVFKQKSNIIIANRIDPALEDVKTKLFTRDLFGAD